MRVLLWHGYLLSGSGSNLYTRNVARVWRAQGHDVLLLCQEHRINDYDFIDEHGDFSQDNSESNTIAAVSKPAIGRCRLVRPAIGEILPVYVYDEYEFFTAKTFVDLTDSELIEYTDANVRALRCALTEHEPDAVITGHEVMGPYVALQACRETPYRYAAKLHGSALEYAVKRQDRYLRYAREGLCGAAKVIGGSRYMVAEAARVVPGWESRSAVVNPGCDVELFRPAVRRDAGGSGGYTVGYAGKLIASKGVHHLLAALGRVKARPLRAVIVGYGGFEEQLRRLWSDLVAGDLAAAREIARRGEDGPLDQLASFLDDLPDERSYVASLSEVELSFRGRLEHDRLSRLLPSFDVLVVPSVVPEAFGMVAAEAAACGVLPIVPAHSGIGEVGRAVEECLDRTGLLTFQPDDAIAGIAARIDAVLQASQSERTAWSAAAADLARRRWSWRTTADALLAHAASV